MENRLRCSTRTKMDLGRGLSNQGGRKGFLLHQENWTLTNSIMCLSTFDNAFQCLDVYLPIQTSMNRQIGHLKHAETDKKCRWQLAGRTWTNIKNVLNRHRGRQWCWWKYAGQTWMDIGYVLDGHRQTRLQNYVGGNGWTCEMHG